MIRRAPACLDFIQAKLREFVAEEIVVTEAGK